MSENRGHPVDTDSVNKIEYGCDAAGLSAGFAGVDPRNESGRTILVAGAIHRLAHAVERIADKLEGRDR